MNDGNKQAPAKSTQLDQAIDRSFASATTGTNDTVRSFFGKGIAYAVLGCMMINSSSMPLMLSIFGWLFLFCGAVVIAAIGPRLWKSAREDSTNS